MSEGESQFAFSVCILEKESTNKPTKNKQRNLEIFPPFFLPLRLKNIYIYIYLRK